MTKKSRNRAKKEARKAARIAKAKHVKMIKHGIVKVEVPVGALPVVLVDPVKPHVVSVVALPPKKDEAVGFWASIFGTK